MPGHPLLVEKRQPAAFIERVEERQIDKTVYICSAPMGGFEQTSTYSKRREIARQGNRIK
jgi:hypothetical protein